MKNFKEYILEASTNSVSSQDQSTTVKTKEKQRQELKDLKDRQSSELERSRRTDFEKREQDRKRADSKRANTHRASQTSKDYLEYSRLKENHEESGKDEPEQS